jgi:hypothetical protein
MKITRLITALLLLIVIAGCATSRVAEDSPFIPTIHAFWHPKEENTLVLFVTVMNQSRRDQVLGFYSTWVEYEAIVHPDLSGSETMERHPIGDRKNWHGAILEPGERVYLYYTFELDVDEETPPRSLRVSFEFESRPSSKWEELHQKLCWQGELVATTAIPPRSHSSMPDFDVVQINSDTPLGVWMTTNMYETKFIPEEKIDQDE